MRDHIGYRTAVHRHDEGLALGDPAHDRRVVVAQLRLPDLLAHSVTIALS
ncbi:hypothetical protein Ae168Ps1_3966 [Pseudonocardia sp. Ae168_Ps1]|nr:hypothetical protein Ae168Ps1_3966 [Pseudonocardia sp. Ae168_Ps1]